MGLNPNLNKTVFLDINHTFSPNLNVDADYQLQIIHTALSGLVNQTNHTLLLQFFINLKISHAYQNEVGEP